MVNPRSSAYKQGSSLTVVVVQTEKIVRAIPTVISHRISPVVVEKVSETVTFESYYESNFNNILNVGKSKKADSNSW